MKNNYDKLECNNRQKELLRVLEESGDNYIYQINIAKKLPQYYSFEDNKMFHDSPARYTMTKDIRDINKNINYPKTIISNANGVKIANRNEFKDALKKEFGMIFRKLARANIKKEKGGLDGQMTLSFLNNEESFINAFID